VNEALAPASPPDLEAIAELQPRLASGIFALAWQPGLAYAEAPLLGAFGGHLLGPNDAFGFVGPEAERAVALSRSLVEKGVVPEDADGALVTDLFRSGHAAYAISGPWLAADLGPSPAVKYHVAARRCGRW
jgi:arabinogalactan oligomer/maltooligosaccharide transport system permease protein